MAYGSSYQDRPFPIRQKRIPNQLQGGCREPSTQDRDRSRWERTQIEKATIERYKKEQQIDGKRVENIEVYQRGYNDGSFVGIIGDKETDQGFVELHDLEIDGHPSYFANDILVHNCHKGSNSFQNGLLKALEDTPKHVHFILCTTEPKKLIATVRNRCTSFKTENQSVDNICRLIEEVLDAEGVDDFDTETIEALAEASLGSPRDALKRLDQVLDLGPDERMEAISNIADQKQIIDLCQALIKQKPWSKVAGILKDIEDDPEQVRQAVNGYMSKVLLNNKDIHKQAKFILVCFAEPNFYNGKPGLVQACANIYN